MAVLPVNLAEGGARWAARPGRGSGRELWLLGDDWNMAMNEVGLLVRSRRGDSSTERLIIELKRPNVRVGKKELDQIKGYARAIVDDPQYSGVDCTWRFYLITYKCAEKILRDIRQKDKPESLADDHHDYEVWVDWAQFSGGEVDFIQAEFSDSEVDGATHDFPAAWSASPAQNSPVARSASLAQGSPTSRESPAAPSTSTSPASLAALPTSTTLSGGTADFFLADGVAPVGLVPSGRPPLPSGLSLPPHWYSAGR
ncbi:hypothetical protein [Streptomyces canus]|uniref:hypothetical protein n=1 Tax=Streptomyces canus TaxID=58343 RepID=UPI003243AC62